MIELGELIPVGKINATHGIKGQLRVYSYSGNVESLQSASKIVLKRKAGSLLDAGIKKISAHSGGFVMALDGFDTIDLARELVGAEVCLRKGQLPRLAEGEYYWRDLLGLNVVTDQGVELGHIVDIFETGSNDVYVVGGALKEYLIPAIADVISMIDVPGKRMIITPLDGLLEL